MRKLVVWVLALTLVMGSVSMAFAGTAQFPDVDDEDVLEAVERLSAFGIVEGFGDGTIRPEEMITRAQMAKLIVTTLGLESAAEAAMYKSQFYDIAGDEWFAGYVNVAVGQGLVKGYPDGMFRPYNQLTYSEAATMLVRALGYKDEFLPGLWPGNYIAKAADLDITDDVRFATNGGANRGSLFIMVDNALDANIIEQSSYGDDNNWTEQDEKLLERALGIEIEKDVKVIGVPYQRNIDDDEIRLTELGKLDLDGQYVNNLLGLSGDCYYDDDEFKFFDVDNDYEVFYDEITRFSDDEATLTILDDDFDVDEDIEVSINGDDVDPDDSDLDGIFAKVVFDGNNDISYVEAFDFDEVEGGIVEYISRDDEIEYVLDDENTDDLDLGDRDIEYVIFDNRGYEMTIDDISVGDIIYVAQEDGSDEDLVVFVAKDTTIEGELDGYDGTTTLEIDGDEYDTSIYLATSSTDDDDEINEISTDDLKDLLGEDVEVTFDLVGHVRHISGEGEASSDEIYGIFWASDASFGEYSVKISALNGDKTVYDLDLDNDETLDAVYKYENGEPEGSPIDLTPGSGRDKEVLLRFTLDKDGDIDEMGYLIADVTSTGEYTELDTDDDYGRDSIPVGSDYYYVQDNTVIVDLEDYATGSTTLDADDIEFVNWSVLSNENVDSGYVFVYDENEPGKNQVELVVFLGGSTVTGDDVYAGYVLDKKAVADDMIRLELDIPGEGIDYYYADDGLNNIEDVDEKKAYEFTFNSDGTIDSVDPIGVEFDKEVLDIEDVDGDYLVDETADPDEYYKTDDETIYYDGTDEQRKSDVEGDFNVTLVLDGNKVLVVYW